MVDNTAQPPIQIVPLQDIAAAAPPATAAQLTYRGGPLLTSVQVATVFWGSAWDTSLSGQSDQINAFFDAILQSALIDQLAEYSVSGYSIGHGSRIATLTVTDSDPAPTVQDADIQQLVQSQIGQGNLPAIGANTLYFVFLPPGVTVSMGGGQSCSAFCGYHDTAGAGLYYAVVPSPDCSGCLGGLAVFQALTTVTSHELCEAITDPVPGQGWYDDTNGEIGDICAWQTKVVDGYTVQREWSNSQNACV